MNKEQIEKSSKEIAKKLDVAIIDSKKALEKSIKKLEKKIISHAAMLKTSKGKLMSLKINFTHSKKLYKDIVILFEKEYGTAITKEVKRLDKIVGVVLLEFKGLEVATEFTAIDEDMINVLKKNTYAQFEQFGIDARRRVSQAMYDSIIAQAEFGELVSTFSGIMVGGKDVLGRSMSAYAKLYANDAIMNFHQSVLLQKAQTIGLEYFLYAGTAMATTRPFCRQRLMKVYSQEEIQSWDFKWKGKSGPALTHRGGYNCRHHWRPIKKEWMED